MAAVQVYSEMKSEIQASYQSRRTWTPSEKTGPWSSFHEQLVIILQEVTIRSTFLEIKICCNSEDTLERGIPKVKETSLNASTIAQAAESEL